MKYFTVFLLLFSASFFSNAEPTKSKRSAYALHKMEAVGVKHYKRGNYRRAYQKLINAAHQGMKQAQYFMGFMYLKGQHVEQSAVLGTVWLGLAKESQIKEWVITYDNVYAVLSKEQKGEVDKKLLEYIDKYGMEAQDVKCEKRRNSIRARNKDSIICQKIEFDKVQQYDIGH